MEKQTKINSLNTIAAALNSTIGNVELVKQVTGLTETADIMAVLIATEKLAKKLVSRITRKSETMAAKPAKVKKERVKKEAPVVTEGNQEQANSDMAALAEVNS